MANQDNFDQNKDRQKQVQDQDDPRLKQDAYERKDKENSSAGMIAGFCILILGIVSLYLYYTYEVDTTTVQSTTPNAAQIQKANSTNAPNKTTPATR